MSYHVNNKRQITLFMLDAKLEKRGTLVTVAPIEKLEPAISLFVPTQLYRIKFMNESATPSMFEVWNLYFGVDFLFHINFEFLREKFLIRF